MHNPATPLHLLWLDPFRALGDAEAAQLAAAGLVPQAVSTLDELRQSVHDFCDSKKILPAGLQSA